MSKVHAAAELSCENDIDLLNYEDALNSNTNDKIANIKCNGGKVVNIRTHYDKMDNAANIAGNKDLSSLLSLDKLTNVNFNAGKTTVANGKEMDLNLGINKIFSGADSVHLENVIKTEKDKLLRGFQMGTEEVIPQIMNVCSLKENTTIVVDEEIHNSEDEDDIIMSVENMNTKHNMSDDMSVRVSGGLTLNFIDDGIEFVDDQVEFIEEQKQESQKNVDKEQEIEDVDNELTDNANEESKFDLKLLMTPVVYTTKLNDMLIFKRSNFDVVSDLSIIDRALLESKPRSLKEVGSVDNCDADQDKTPTLSLSSHLLKKPICRKYNPILLCKNPDFNTRLKRLNVGFFSSLRNRQLYKACKPMTVDVSKEFESKLINGVLYVKPGETGAPHEEKMQTEICSMPQHSSVLPSAMSVQSLLDHTVSIEFSKICNRVGLTSDTKRATNFNVNERVDFSKNEKTCPINDMKTVNDNMIQQSTNEHKSTTSISLNNTNTAFQSESSVPSTSTGEDSNITERKKTINLPDIIQVRRINQQLLTAEISPMRLDCHTEATVPEMSHQSQNETTINNSHQPDKPTDRISLNTIRRQKQKNMVRSSWRKPLEKKISYKMPNESLLTFDTLTKMLVLLNGDQIEKAKTKKKKSSQKSIAECTEVEEANTENDGKSNEALTMLNTDTAQDKTTMATLQLIERGTQVLGTDTETKNTHTNLNSEIISVGPNTRNDSKTSTTVQPNKRNYNRKKIDAQNKTPIPKIRVKRGETGVTPTFKVYDRPPESNTALNLFKLKYNHCCWIALKIKKPLLHRPVHMCRVNTCTCCCRGKLYESIEYYHRIRYDKMCSRLLNILPWTESNKILQSWAQEKKDKTTPQTGIKQDSLKSLCKPGIYVDLEEENVLPTTTQTLEDVPQDVPLCIEDDTNGGPTTAQGVSAVSTTLEAIPIANAAVPQSSTVTTADTALIKPVRVDSLLEKPLTPQTIDNSEVISLDDEPLIPDKAIPDCLQDYEKQSTNTPLHPIQSNLSMSNLKGTKLTVNKSVCTCNKPIISLERDQNKQLVIDGSGICPIHTTKLGVPSKTIKSKLFVLKKISSEKPIYLGKNQVLLTSAKFPDEKNAKAPAASLPQVLPSGVTFTLTPEGILSCNMNPDVQLTESQLAALPEITTAMQTQLTPVLSVTPVAPSPSTVQDVDLTFITDNENDEPFTKTTESTAEPLETISNFANNDQFTSDNQIQTSSVNLIPSMSPAPTDTKHIEENTQNTNKVIDNINNDENTCLSGKESLDENVNKNKTTILSDLMAMSGISSDDTAVNVSPQQSPSKTRETNKPTDMSEVNESGADENALPSNSLSGQAMSELTVVTSYAKLKYACSVNARFFKLNFDTGYISPINLCITSKLSKVKKKCSLEADDCVIDLTEDLDNTEPEINETRAQKTQIERKSRKPYNEIKQRQRKYALSHTIYEKRVKPLKLFKVSHLKDQNRKTQTQKTANAKTKKEKVKGQDGTLEKRKATQENIEAKINLLDSDEPMEEEYLEDFSADDDLPIEKSPEYSSDSDDEPLSKLAKRIHEGGGAASNNPISEIESAADPGSNDSPSAREVSKVESQHCNDGKSQHCNDGEMPVEDNSGIGIFLLPVDEAEEAQEDCILGV